MALLLQLRTRTKRTTFINPSLFHFFSTSNSNDDEPESTAASYDDTPSTNSNSPYSSYFSDVKEVLKQGQSTSSFFTARNPSNSSFTASGSASPTPSKPVSFDEMRKSVTQFRRRFSGSDPDSTPPSSSSSNKISLQECYRRNMDGKPGGRLEMKMAFLKTYKHEELGEKLKKLRPPAKGGDGFSLRELNDRLVKLREMDEKENAQSTPDVFGLADLKNVLNKLKESDNQERKTTQDDLSSNALT